MNFHHEGVQVGGYFRTADLHLATEIQCNSSCCIYVEYLET